jgi:transcription antitermination factor NusG
MAHRIITSLLILLLLAACGGTAGTTGSAQAPGSTGSRDETGGSGTTGGAASPAASTGGAPAPPAAGGNTDSAGEQPVAERNPQGQFNRLVIRTANISLIVQNVDSAEAQIRQIAESRGGFVLGSEVNGDDEQRRAAMSFKVPALRFDEALAAVAKLALDVEAQNVQGQDVTDEFVDLESRVRNLRAVETRLLDFLKQAQKVEEALQVNQQLTEIQGQIEQAQGRISYLKESASYSTINVSMRGQPIISVTPDNTWSPGTTARAAAQNLIAFAQVIADILIVLGVWFPIWLPALIVGLWFWRRSRRVPNPTTQP